MNRPKIDVPMSYPYFDLAWLGKDESGRLGVFITAGAGPIPGFVLGAASLSIGEIEGRLLKLPVTCRPERVLELRDPTPFFELARRGFYVYDWQNIHRPRIEYVSGYDLVCCPGIPLDGAGLDEVTRNYLAYLPPVAVGFEDERVVDPRVKVPCVERQE